MSKENNNKRSFFDGMDEFNTREKVGLDSLKKLKEHASCYNEDDLHELKKLQKRPSNKR